ncbi:MAG: 5'-methylthioadenosine/adenosylhomocysteine nucleosidase [Clostridia bacterium]|nr:5'-methylthioadenosine/adenosylhomocysteine nucleosidase [Clostridia bacterium]
MTKHDHSERAIGIIAAMQIEIDGIKKKLTDNYTVNISGIDFECGYIGDRRVVCAKCGVGKVFAALCAQTMCMKFALDCIINTGVAGGLADGLKVLDVVVAGDVVQHDMDTSPLGDPVGLLSGINIVNIPCDKNIADTLSECVKAEGIKCITGTVATGDQFVCTEEKRQYIKSTFNAAACEMEGGAIGHVCYVNEVPFGIIRAISDGGDDAASLDYPTFARLAADNSVKAVLRFIETYR